MRPTSILRRLATYGVLIAGAATTIATSAPANPTEFAQATREVEALEAVRVEVLLNAAATEHLRRHEEAAVIELNLGGPAGIVVPDDEGSALAAVPGTERTPATRCPESGDCVLGFTVEAEEAGILAATVRVTVSADSRFLFPENRRFPEEAEVSVVIE
jgi:hypothetical protein